MDGPLVGIALLVRECLLFTTKGWREEIGVNGLFNRLSAKQDVNSKCMFLLNYLKCAPIPVFNIYTFSERNTSHSVNYQH